MSNFEQDTNLGQLMRPYQNLPTCRISLLIIGLLVFIVCYTSSFVMAAEQINQDTTQTIRPETTAGLQAFFQALDYDWMQLENGVPPLILENIPTDIRKAKSALKKRTFFMGLLPMVLLANQEIVEEREEILQILQKHETKNSEESDRTRLDEISKRYGLRGRPIVDHRARSRLLQRVDIIPPSLVLAQAANESAWGTSRFARLGNNLFGEWTYKPGTGIVPAGRPPGEIYEVRKFSSIYESIRSYMNNLNRNGAYRDLREVRAMLRKSGQPITGIALANGLTKYSQRGEEYISEIQSMIRQNKLSRTGRAYLRQPETEVFTSIKTTGSGLFSTRNRSIGHFSPARLNP
jgi:Bax protein